MTTPESKQWPPSLPEKSASADAWLQMFEATRDAVESTQRACKTVLRDMKQNDLMFEIYESDNPTQPYKVGHGLHLPPATIHSKRKMLWVPNALSVNIIREGISKETRHALASVLFHSYAGTCWVEHMQEQGERNFSMDKRDQYQDPKFLAYAAEMKQLQPLYQILFTGRMKRDDIHLFAADTYT